MKKTSFARRIVKARLVFVLLAVLGMGGLGLWMGDSLKAKYARTTATQTEWPAPPNVSLHELFAVNW